MVSVKSLSDDFYYYDEENYRYLGQHKGKIYRLGDPVRIRIKDVDLAKKQMNFVFV
jgi:ribonuclease R